MAMRELGEAHGGDNDGARFACWAREKAIEGERARNGWSSGVASLFTLLWLDQLSQCWRTIGTWWPLPSTVGH